MTNHDITTTATATDAKGRATITLHGGANDWTETGKRAAAATHVVVHTDLTGDRVGYQWLSLHATAEAAFKTADKDAAPGRDGTVYWTTQVVEVTR